MSQRAPEGLGSSQRDALAPAPSVAYEEHRGFFVVSCCRRCEAVAVARLGGRHTSVGWAVWTSSRARVLVARAAERGDLRGVVLFTQTRCEQRLGRSSSAHAPAVHLAGVDAFGRLGRLRALAEGAGARFEAARRWLGTAARRLSQTDGAGGLGVPALGLLYVSESGVLHEYDPGAGRFERSS